MNPNLEDSRHLDKYAEYETSLDFETISKILYLIANTANEAQSLVPGVRKAKSVGEYEVTVAELKGALLLIQDYTMELEDNLPL